MDHPLHPMLVHFPIALLFVSVLFDLLSLAISRDSLRHGALWLLGLALLSGIVAALAGGLAEEAAERAGIAESLIENHEHFAQLTLGLMGALFAVRLLLRNHFGPRIGTAYAIGAAIALAAVSVTGYTGGDLVYKYGAGVQTAAPPAASLDLRATHE